MLQSKYKLATFTLNQLTDNEIEQVRKEQTKLANMIGNQNIGFYSREQLLSTTQESKKDEDFIDPNEEGKTNEIKQDLQGATGEVEKEDELVSV